MTKQDDKTSADRFSDSMSNLTEGQGQREDQKQDEREQDRRDAESREEKEDK
jgi:hypothetical protein